VSREASADLGAEGGEDDLSEVQEDTEEADASTQAPAPAPRKELSKEERDELNRYSRTFFRRGSLFLYFDRCYIIA
jgi:hypothetical protein